MRNTMMQKTLHIIRESGMSGLGRRAVAFAYRRGVRPWLPSAGFAHYAGIPVASEFKWGDRIVPVLWRPPYDEPEYEATLVAALEEHVLSGDRVVVVGGGMGVTASIAALRAGPFGSVHCFEGASECVEKVRRTAHLNGVAERITVHHAVVARAIRVYGTEPNRAEVSPTELPQCDLLQLDCEGAEVDILGAMSIRPRTIVVESHGLYGAATSHVRSLLRERGYQVSDRGVAEPRSRAFCEEWDVRVLVGSLAHDQGTRITEMTAQQRQRA